MPFLPFECFVIGLHKMLHMHVQNFVIDLILVTDVTEKIKKFWANFGKAFVKKAPVSVLRTEWSLTVVTKSVSSIQ